VFIDLERIHKPAGANRPQEEIRSGRPCVLHPDKIRDRPVIGLLIFFREEACGKFAVASVVVEALAAVIFPLA
jgi:hypothetical protein